MGDFGILWVISDGFMLWHLWCFASFVQKRHCGRHALGFRRLFVIAR